MSQVNHISEILPEVLVDLWVKQKHRGEKRRPIPNEEGLAHIKRANEILGYEKSIRIQS